MCNAARTCASLLKRRKSSPYSCAACAPSQSNGELVAARLEVARARALYVRRDSDSNPTIDFEQTTGRLTGPGHES